MPCNSEHMMPNEFEREMSKIEAINDELETEVMDRSHFGGYHPRAYCRRPTREEINHATAMLCSRLQRVDVSKMSLEAQTWWRDHKEADRKRAQKQIDAKTNEDEKKAALAKLTPHERRLLGL